MDPPLADASRPRAPGRGGKPRGGRQLVLKRTATPAPSPPLGYSPAPPPVPPPLPPISAPTAPNPTPATPNSTPATPISSPAVPSSNVLPRPPQGVAWGAIPPNLPSVHGNQQGSNSWAYPPGGFVNFLQQSQYTQPQQYGENFHLVGQSMSYNPMSPPPPSAYGTGRPKTVKQGTRTKETVNIDIEEGDTVEAKPVKKHWTPDEEERLASAWLNASKDPIHGNDKKYDTFWKEVTDEFNRKGNGKRPRIINQLKVHWSRLKTSISEFNDYYIKITQMHTSGYSDDMLEEEAQKMYENKFGKRFSLVHWWKKLKDEPKWCAQFEDKEKDLNELVDVEDPQSRPIGREAAKAERSGKRRKENIMEGIVILRDNVEKIVHMQQDRKVEREKAT